MCALEIVGITRCWPRFYALSLKVVFLCLIFLQNMIINLYIRRNAVMAEKQTNTSTHT